MREDDVAARLRSVLSATSPGVRDQTAADRRAPGLSSRYAAGLGDLAAVGDPLSWSDVVPGWPDDVDLDPLPALEPSADVLPAAAPAGSVVVAPGVVALPPVADETGGYRPGTPWASPPASSPAFPAAEVDDVKETEPMPGAGDRKPLPPPAWVSPRDDGPEPPPAAGPEWPAEVSRGWEWTPEADDGSRLSAAGAFGRRAFDPGRRGVRVLAVVAAVVILIAAVLAWRARPRVDPVAPPVFETSPSAGRAGPSSAAPAQVVVAVAGKVRKPGLVRLPPGARVADALTAAGGVQPGVDVALLNLARKVIDGELIAVGVTAPPGAALPGPAATGPAGGPVNLNTATLAELDGLPGVGPVLAQRIIDTREAQGGFTAVGDLRTVSGIGDARFEQLKDLVTV